MKYMLALLWVLIFLPSALAGDYMIQDIPLTVSDTADVVMSDSNSYTVIDGQDAYVQQSIEFDGTSWGNVDQSATNMVDWYWSEEIADNIWIEQSITEIAVAEGGYVSQFASNTALGDLGYNAYVSQYIDQQASAGSGVSQYANNLMIGDLNGDYDCVFQDIDQSAYGNGYVFQSATGGNYIGGLYGVGDINGDYFWVDQSIDQEAFSYGYVNQDAGTKGNEIGYINGGDGIATQSIYQAAEGYDSYVTQNAGDIYGNYIYAIYGGDNIISQDITQAAISDYGYVDQYAYYYANYIDGIASYANGNTVIQNVLQLGLAAGTVDQYAYSSANTIANGIYDADYNTVDQEITQAGVGYDVYQYADYCANYVPTVYGDYDTVVQGILQLGSASDAVTQDAADSYANYLDSFEGYGFTLDQDITQAGVSGNDVYQYADTGNELYLYYGSYGDYAVIGQTILQLAAGYDYVCQDASNDIDYSITGNYADVDQVIIQAATGYGVAQYAEGNYLYEIYGDESLVYQDILQLASTDSYANQYADYGNDIDYLNGDYAYVSQYITQAAVSNQVDQDGLNIIDYVSGTDPITYQKTNQVASADYLGQYAYNNIIYLYLDTDATIYQYIESYADSGSSLYQDFENYALLTGPSNAFVQQYIDVGTYPTNGGTWYQENTIDNGLWNILDPTQIDFRNGIDVDNNNINYI
jgi:hypothetical protein